MTAPTLLTLLCLLILATSAAAECAWVVWRNGAPPRNSFRLPADDFPLAWVPGSTYSTRSECMDYVATIPDTHSPGNAVAADGIAYRCLPDTIDPRGPKGSKSCSW